MKHNPKAAKFIAFHAVLTAIMLLSVIFPAIGPVALAFLPLVSVLISALFLGFWHGVLTGLIFGLVSLISSFAAPATPLAPMFQNPLISVVPRIFIGMAAYGTMRGIRKLFPRLRPIFADTIGAFVGVVVNTTLVLGLILLIYNGVGVITPVLIGTIVLTNSILEVAICTILTPPVIAALRKNILL